MNAPSNQARMAAGPAVEAARSAPNNHPDPIMALSPVNISCQGPRARFRRDDTSGKLRNEGTGERIARDPPNQPRSAPGCNSPHPARTHHARHRDRAGGTTTEIVPGPGHPGHPATPHRLNQQKNPLFAYFFIAYFLIS
ncbi:hypothetical protein GLI01_07050 [Gluconacetobacter liquefaciens]|nr:hypothetical protein GLI01_07050 [Gluconacetobacter liquefaciens]